MNCCTDHTYTDSMPEPTLPPMEVLTCALRWHLDRLPLDEALHFLGAALAEAQEHHGYEINHQEAIRMAE